MANIRLRNAKLDEYEQEIEDGFDHLKPYPEDEKKEKMKMHQKAAKNYLPSKNNNSNFD